MDKNSYESYEYAPANEQESEPDQFYIVQNNGTFIIDANRQVQYLTQVQNAKDPSQPCTVYDVAPQQFLVDVDNTSELMAVSEQYVSEAQNNLFPSSYLLQPRAPTVSETMEHNVAENLNQDEVGEISKQTGACTEITLSDEQYHMLEQKGWLLLEIGDKVYVLNTLGLHDITTNEKLIEKLKNERESITIQDINIGTCNLGNDAMTIFQTDFKELPSMSNQVGESVQDGEKVDSVNHNSMDDSSVLIDDTELNEVKPVPFTDSPMSNEDSPEEQDSDTKINSGMNTRVLVIENENIRRVGNTLKIKTKLSLKDFPDKIHLGKSRNGKNLVAKVIKPKTDADNENLEIDKKKPDENPVLISLSAPYNNAASNTAESEFYMLLQHLFWKSTKATKCSADDVVTADSVILQLLQIPAFKPSVIDNDLIIIKVFQKVDSTGKIINKVLSAVVTGRVSQIGDQWRFIHLPHMLQRMINDTDKIVAESKKNGAANSYVIKDEYSVLHVQIAETKDVNSVVRISVTVNKRNIPIQLLTNRNQHQPNKMYACSACAAIYGTELELKDHQADHILETEDMLTIEVDQTSKPPDLCVIETDKGKSYTCMQCNATFNRLTACKNHLKTHCGKSTMNTEMSESVQEENKNKAVYKCYMCTCTYFHPSTLSKHILSRHINKVSLLPDSNMYQTNTC